MRIGGARFVNQLRSPQSSSDSPLETSRIEPSVPRETTKVSRDGLVSALLAATEKAARRDPISRRRRDLPRDRWFESGFLQRGVRCELDPTGSATCLLRATRPFHAGVDVDHRKPRIVAETNGTNGVQADHPLVQRRSAECGTAPSNVSDRVCYWSLSCGPNYAGAPGQEPLMDEDVLGWIREQAAGVRYPRAALRPASACIRMFLALPL